MAIQKKVRFEAEHMPLNKLPQPVGWRVLVGMIKIENTTEGGIALLDESVEKQEYLRSVGKVLAVGEDVYKHPKFQGGIELSARTPQAWCNVGDIVLVGQYAGQTVRCVDEQGDVQKVKLLNDDEVLAVIPDVNAIYT